MSGRRLWLLAGAVAALVGVGAAAAGEPVRVITHEEFRGLQARLVAGDFGRILDLNISDLAPERTEMKIFAGGADITRSVRSRPPVIEIIYLFAGVPAADECSFKLQLDAALHSISASNQAYSIRDTILCPQAGILPLDRWRPDVVLADEYRRRLVIGVGDQLSIDVLFDSEIAWATLLVPEVLFDDKAQLIRQVTGFVDKHIFGQWSVVPPDLAPSDTPLTITFADAGGVFHTMQGANASTAVNPALVRFYFLHFLAGKQLIAIVAGGAIIVGLAVVVLRSRRRRTASARTPTDAGAPRRAIAIGYGAGRQYSLGGGAERDVARVMVYDGGRMRLLRDAPDERILVNGAAVGDDAWITADDLVVIGAKQFRFT